MTQKYLYVIHNFQSKKNGAENSITKLNEIKRNEAETTQNLELLLKSNYTIKTNYTHSEQKKTS